MRKSQRIMMVFGTRPEAIKMAPIYRALLADPDAFDPLCCVTAQHRQMLDQALSIFGIEPNIDLDLMRPGRGLAEVSAAVLSAMPAELDRVAPDLVLVHGDTTTSMAAALAAFYAGIPVGHVEAGLRTANLHSPFPEEFNRRIVGTVARYHFAPTEAARRNLERERCNPASIVVTGNTVVDALTAILDKLDADSAFRGEAERHLDRDLPFDWRRDPFILVTCHRRETFTHGLAPICAAIEELSKLFPRLRLVLPVHHNPLVREPLEKLLSGLDSVHLVAPLPYDAFLIALRSCRLALTDSGGIQEEAPTLGKPVLVMRDVTERPEGVAAGIAQLVGARTAGIVSAAKRLLTDEAAYARMVATCNPYGDGLAASRVADFLKRAWSSAEEPAAAPDTSLSSAPQGR